jgi:hypothetical protein
LFDFANFLKFYDLPVVTYLLNVGLTVAREHYSIGVLHYVSLVLEGLAFTVQREVGLVGSHFNFFIEFLHLDMVRKLGHAVSHLASHENAVSTVQELLVFVFPTFLFTQLNRSFGKAKSSSRAHHVHVLLVSSKEVTVEFLENFFRLES